MPKGIHVSAFMSLRTAKKYARVEGSHLDLERVDEGKSVVWEAKLKVFDADGRPELGELLISYKDTSRTVWAAVWKINGYGVAKIDVEREPSLNLDDTEFKGRLNRRKRTSIEAFLPHWRFIGEDGEWPGKHEHDPKRFPVNMPIDKAVPKWCHEELNLEIQPSDIKYFKKTGSQREIIGVRTLFKWA